MDANSTPEGPSSSEERPTGARRDGVRAAERAIEDATVRGPAALALAAALFALVSPVARADATAGATAGTNGGTTAATNGGTTGFVAKHEVVVPLAPAAAYEQVLRVQEWWDPAHTYTGVAANLSLRAEPGGCWCEALPGGGFIEHMRVVLAWPEKLLRFHGALGPLQSMGVAGALTFAFKPEGEGTRVTMTYSVGGHAADGFAGLSKPVDGVLGAALARYAATAGAKR